tara:strand:- start:25101 stop:25841 length:741 start_codon:yes stop_codon:yes gene_type:complete
MNRLLILLLFTFGYGFSQTNCELCVEQNGFYCGDDSSNWTQYSPNGCVPNGLNGLFYLNDGWQDCVDGSDEQDAVPTTIQECSSEIIECDTVYVDVPVYIYETIFQTDTIYNTEYITQIVVDTIVEIEYETIFEEIFVTDTLWMEGALDTMFVDVIEYVDVFIFDTIVEIETEYVEIFVVDTVIEYVEIINTEYLDCDTGLPCTSNIPEIIQQSKKDKRIFNLLGQAIKEPDGLYIQDGVVKYKIN